MKLDVHSHTNNFIQWHFRSEEWLLGFGMGVTLYSTDLDKVLTMANHFTRGNLSFTNLA